MPREERRTSSFKRRPSSSSYYSPPKVCQFCTDKNVVIDYKNTELLRRYVTDEGKIRPRRQTGACALHQRALAAEIKRSRYIALLPYTGKYWEEGR